jgi:hypothetical protein
MKISRFKAIISTILIVSALFSLSTGAILYFLQYGMWLCFTRGFLNDIHALSRLAMGIAIVVHIIVNRHLYAKEIKILFFRGKKQENQDT